jgi:peptidoglycan/xylan/chitin deacetylase (PgdA/CDA1 family)
MVGRVTLSLELELAWGMHRKKSYDAYLSAGRRRETAFLRLLLDRCDELGVPLTFNIVGHLLLESCDGSHRSPHPDPGWFRADPGTDVSRDPLFYAPDLIEDVCNAAVDHEVATHTFSHVNCDEVPEAVIDWELDAARKEHESFGCGAQKSFVAPRHRHCPRTVLSRNGIETIRVPDPGYRRPDRLVSYWVLTRRHPTSRPAMVDGMLETYCTPHPSLTTPLLPKGQAPPAAHFRAIPRRTRQWLQERYLRAALDAAVRNDSYVHLWTHLWDMSNEAQWVPIDSFLETLAAYVDDGRVEMHTMASLNAQVREHTEGGPNRALSMW